MDRPPAARLPTDARRADATRRALLDAAIRVFGRDGFDAASNRALAETAGVNQALIGYHFGGKEGLYLAVFEHVAAELGERLDALAADVEARLATLATATSDARRAEAVETVSRVLAAHLRLLMEPGMADYARLILREQIAPSRAFDILWNGMLGRLLGALTRLVALADPAADPRVTDLVPDASDTPGESHRLLALTLFGQTLVFRVARATVLAHTGWPETLGEREIAAVEARLRANVALLLGGGTPP